VSVRFFATVREAAGVPSVTVDAADIGELLEALGDRFGPRFSRLLGEPAPDPERVVVLLNGRNLGRKLSMDRRLSDGDDIAIFPPVSGG